MSTGENEQALRKILDMTRMIAIVILSLHFYYYCYAAFQYWKLSMPFTDQLLGNIAKTGLFKSFNFSKLISLAFLAISLMGAKGKKEEKLNYRTAIAYLVSGVLSYFISYLILLINIGVETKAVGYISLTGLGFILILSGGTLISRIIRDKLSKDIFNR